MKQKSPLLKCWIIQSGDAPGDPVPATDVGVFAGPEPSCFIIASQNQWLLQCNGEIFQRSNWSHPCNSNRSNDVRLDVATPIFLPDMRWSGWRYEVIAAILADQTRVSVLCQSVSQYCAGDIGVLRSHICQYNNLSAEICWVCSRERFIHVNQLMLVEWSGDGVEWRLGCL